MGRLFGTDGVRGIANRELTPELAFKLGKAGTFVLKKESKRPIIIIGKDTRVSGDMLENALTAGILAVGGNVIKVGVLPTPAIAFLTKRYGADAGIVNTTALNFLTGTATSSTTSWRRRSKTSSSAALMSTAILPEI